MKKTIFGAFARTVGKDGDGNKTAKKRKDNSIKNYTKLNQLRSFYLLLVSRIVHFCLCHLKWSRRLALEMYFASHYTGALGFSSAKVDLSLIYLYSAVIALLVLSYFLSGAETALVSASASWIHRMKQSGDKRAILVSALRDKKEKVIGTIIMVNTVVNIVASSLSAAVFIKMMGSDGLFFSTVFMTLVILLFAEVLPKTYAIHNPEGVALISARLVAIFVWLFSPFTIAAQFLVNGVLRLLRLNHAREVMPVTEVMRNFISLHYAENSMMRQDLDMLNSILDLAETEISQVMTHRKNIFALNIDQNIRSLIMQILESSHSRVPLWKNRPDNIVGIVHGKDLLNALIKVDNDIDKVEINKIISKPWFIPETAPLSTQLHSFRWNHKHLALVIDEYGALQGLVTLEDILEEIVGDINDEHDVIGATLVTQVADGVYQINGDMPIRDINRQHRWNLPDQEASTLSGMIINDIERIPDKGEEFFLYGFKFKIVEKNNNVVTKVEVDTFDKKSEEEIT